MKCREKLKSSLINRAFQSIDHKDRVKLFWIALIQTFLGFLDLLGVTFIGALGALSIQGVESKKAGNHVSILLNVLHIKNQSFELQVVILGLVAASTMILKTVLSIYFIRKTFRYMSNRSATMTSDLVAKVLSQNMLEVQKRSSQETLFTLTAGVQALLNGIIATSVNLVSDFSMLIILTISLFFIDPLTAAATGLIFGFIGFILYKYLNVKAYYVNKEITSRTIKNHSQILEVLRSYRESVVRGRRFFYAEQIGKIQSELGHFVAENNFIPYISKYVIDTATVVSSLLLGGLVLSLNNAVHGVATLAVFLAASTRIAPAALRIQQGMISIKASQAPAALTIEMVNNLRELKIINEKNDIPSFAHDHFEPEIELTNVFFKYPNNENYSISNLNLTIKQGESVAIVGTSGSGKTTLIDLILGVLEPELGEIKISGNTPFEIIKKFPGAVAYVPQDVVIVAGTIRQNISLGYPVRIATNDAIKWPSDIAQLSKLVANLDSNFDTEVGEFGNKLSGGERQRVGIARALFTNPKLLVLDEATSSLDGQTESNLTEAIRSLHGDVTVIVVAHRLSTVRHVDKLVYLKNGQIEAIGTFEEVRRRVPEFKQAAKLMGLSDT